MTTSTPTLDEIVKLFDARGNSQYGGEAVTQLEHGLQAALLAEREHAPPELIVAALLHDIGHLLHDLPDDTPDQGVDDHHETSGYRYLEQRFDDAVTEPVRLHVAAKRYLCTTDDDYNGLLSEPSRTSLELQGGKMSPDEVAQFEQNPHAQSAVRLRRWDDLAKDPACETPSLEHFAGYIRQVIGKA